MCILFIIDYSFHCVFFNTFKYFHLFLEALVDVDQVSTSKETFKALVAVLSLAEEDCRRVVLLAVNLDGAVGVELGRVDQKVIIEELLGYVTHHMRRLVLILIREKVDHLQGGHL